MKENITIKLAIIGTGSRGIRCFGKHLGQTSDVNITALCDINPIRLKEASKSLENEPNLYTDAAAMFQKEQLDAVIITSPDFLHEQHAVNALNNGVNVLVDKPLATTVQGCKNIIKAAKNAQKTVMIGFNLRHNPTLRKLKQIVDDDILGNIFLIENREFYNSGRTYMSRWNRKREWSGGLWIHKGSHDFDIFQWLMGFPRPVKVSTIAGISVLNQNNIPFKLKKGIMIGPTCHECFYSDICPDVHVFNDSPEWSDEAKKFDGYSKDLCMYASDKDVHDNGITIIEYDNGAHASHLECFITSFDDRRYTIVGDRGIAEVSLHNRSIIVHPRWSKDIVRYQIAEEGGGHGGADPKIVELFLDIIKGNRPNISTAEHGMWATATGEAAEISFRKNRMVFVKELIE